MHPNRLARTLCDHAIQDSHRMRIGVHEIAGAQVLDFGIEKGTGGIQSGLLLARICLADLSQVHLQAANPAEIGSENLVHMQTDHALLSCLGCQYAGWPVQAGKYFAIASGPMRLVRGREEVLEHFQLVQVNEDSVVGVLETDKFPNAEVITEIASQCQVEPTSITLCVAPVTSIAGCVQVVARSVETALHKMHAVGLDPSRVLTATGSAPLPPPAEDMVNGIGRTNDAILYGGRVTLWVDLPQDTIDQLGPQVPSGASKDYGQPFADTFKSYNYDFYKVDPNLFSPATVTFINVNNGRTTSFGRLNLEILKQSFGVF